MIEVGEDGVWESPCWQRYGHHSAVWDDRDDAGRL